MEIVTKNRRDHSRIMWFLGFEFHLLFLYKKMDKFKGDDAAYVTLLIYINIEESNNATWSFF